MSLGTDLSSEETRAPPVEVRPHETIIREFSQHQVLVLDAALKFAFDVFEVVGEMSESHLKLSMRRPQFHPRCADLMTPEMKLLFKNQWDLAVETKLIYLVMNLPRAHHRGDFVRVLQEVLRSYKSQEFSQRLFVEFAFIIAFWTLVLRQRKEWIGATDFAVELITVFTRHVLDNGGLDGCREWPKGVKVQGADLEIPDVANSEIPNVPNSEIPDVPDSDIYNVADSDIYDVADSDIYDVENPQ